MEHFLYICFNKIVIQKLQLLYWCSSRVHFPIYSNFYIPILTIPIYMWNYDETFYFSRLKMKSTLILVVLGTIVLFGGTVNAWGGLFNRFSPEMLANFVEDPQHRPYSQVNICLCYLFFYFYFLFYLSFCFNVVINRNRSSKRIYFS